MKIACPDCAWTHTGDDGDEQYKTHRLLHRGAPWKDPIDATEEPATPVCKIDGCSRPVVDKAGIYAKLCAEHKAEKKAQRSEPAAVAKTNGLVELAQELERAREYVELARESLEQALQRQADAADRLREAIPETEVPA